jgi:hypothetical protein
MRAGIDGYARYNNGSVLLKSDVLADIYVGTLHKQGPG